MSDLPEFWPDAKLRRKANQHWEMAGLARQDGDVKDEKRHNDLAVKYDRIIKDRLHERL